jgi:transcriptional regulator with XRE-family HTH domain
MTIRERIKQECAKKQISLNKLESDCSLAKGYVSKLDKSVPNATKLQKIADYLGVSLDFLMNGNKDGYYLDDEAKHIMQVMFERPKLKEIFDLFIDLSDEDAGTVIPILQALHNKTNKKQGGD